MAIIVNSVITTLEEKEPVVYEKTLKKLKIKPADVAHWAILKRSVDARNKNDIKLVYSVCVSLKKDEVAVVNGLKNPQILLKKEETLPIIKGSIPLKCRPVIVGFGPAGMFCALFLARHGYRPIVIERGADVDTRIAKVETFWKKGVLDANTNVQYGEGGAGTFSDGKLTTRINDPLCDFVLREFVKHGAPEDILIKAKPHIGTDLLRKVVKSIRKEIIQLGGEVVFENCLEGLICHNGKVTAAVTQQKTIETKVVVLAIGHSAHDTYRMLHNTDVLLEAKPFSVGVRIEHLQTEIDCALYGKYQGHPALPPGEYQLSYREGERAVYTFCMCPGGQVVASSSAEGEIVTNGMSYYARDGKNANSAIVVSVGPSDFGTDPFAAIAFQHKLEQKAFSCSNRYAAPIQTAGLFLQGKGGAKIHRVIPTYPLDTAEADFTRLFPNKITKMLKTGLTVFDKRIRGFACEDAVLTGVETRTSAPVRIPREKETMIAKTMDGIYPCGEGAGYAGGIMSAAVDGIKTALAIIKRYYV